MPHPAIVMHHNGRYFYRCLFNGEVELTSDHVRLFDIDRRAFLDVLAAAAKLGSRSRMSFAEDRLVRLGLVADKGREWVLGYADGLTSPNVFTGVQDAIEKQLPDGPGLIATPSAVHLNTPLPRSYRLISLHELFFAQGEHFTLDWDAAYTRMGRRKKVPGTPGRPSEFEVTRRMRSDLMSRGQWPSTRAAQVNFVEECWPHEEANIPARKTIEAHLRDIEAEE
jgi:hypothetical protein